MKDNKTYLAKIILSSVDSISCDRANAEEYLSAEGLNPDSIRAEGIKRIKRLQMQVRANKTRAEMESTSDATIKQKAADWVEKVLSDARFSFAAFVKEENLVLQNRNLTSFNKEDIKSTLIQFFYLKFLNQEDKGADE